MAPIRSNVERPPSTVACRTKLRHRIQQPYESVGDFLTDLRRLAGDCRDSEQLVCHQLAIGLHDSALRQTTIPDIWQLLDEAGIDSNEAARALTIRTAGMAAILPPCRPTPVPHLPPEVLVTIFEFLNMRDMGRVAQVCRSWRDAADSKVLWRDMTVNLHLSSEHIFSCLARRGVQKIKLMDAIMKSRMPPAMLRSLTGLTHLDLTSSYLPSDCKVRLIAQRFSELVSLELNKISDEPIPYICKGLKKLQILTITDCELITAAGFRKLATAGPPLQFLCLRNFISLTDNSLRCLSLGPMASSLERLELHQCCRISDACIDYIASLKKLHYLKLTLSIMRSDYQLRVIANMTSLRTLDVTDNMLDNTDIEVLTSGSAPIEKLLFANCLFTDESLIHLTAMPYLRELVLKCCFQVTLLGLEYLMRYNKRLTSLEIADCPYFGTGALKCIAAHHQPNLQRLDLRSYSNETTKLVVSKSILKMVARQLPHLTYLMVDGIDLLPKVIGFRQQCQ